MSPNPHLRLITTDLRQRFPPRGNKSRMVKPTAASSAGEDAVKEAEGGVMDRCDRAVRRSAASHKLCHYKREAGTKNRLLPRK